jgi:hypothetical protein
MKNYFKLAIFTTIILCWFITSDIFAVFQDNLYCELTSKSVRIYTQRTKDTLRCSEYIESLEYLIKKEFQDMQKVEIYIYKNQDVDYRKQVKASQIQKINNLQKIRLWVIDSMNLFESNFIKKTQEYMQKKLAPYQKSLETKIAPLGKLWTWYQFSPYIQRQIYLITSQLQSLKDMYTATWTDSFLKWIQNYLYFKKLLEWKSE